MSTRTEATRQAERLYALEQRALGIFMSATIYHYTLKHIRDRVQREVRDSADYAKLQQGRRAELNAYLEAWYAAHWHTHMTLKHYHPVLGWITGKEPAAREYGARTQSLWREIHEAGLSALVWSGTDRVYLAWQGGAEGDATTDAQASIDAQASAWGGRLIGLPA